MQLINRNEDLITQFELELRRNILLFWMNNTLDRENGGFYGAITNNRMIQNQVERSAVLCGRILWTFSTAAMIYKDNEYREVADWAYEYLTTRFWDDRDQGVFWSINRHGQPIQDRKHTYAQAFSIYGLSAYYQATQIPKSLALAKQLFDLIETHTYDPINGGNIECRARDWSHLDDMRLSAIDLNSAKSMNTMLHLMESYAAMYSVWPDPTLKHKLEDLIKVFLTRIIDQDSGHQRLFFDHQWNSIKNHISYGHDIETSWLLLESAEILGDPTLITQARMVSIKMAQAVFDESLGADGTILYEAGPDGHRVLERHWWAHAEAVVGFENAYQISGRTHFKDASQRVWKYIQDHFVDHKDGDWYKLLEQNGAPILSHEKVGPWECPYHHARMCFEMIKRLKQ